MIIQRIHSEIKLRYNKLNSNHLRDIPTAFLDDIINEVIQDYVEMFWNGINYKGYKVGFEVTKQRMDMLSTLVVGESAINALTAQSIISTHTNYNIYQFNLSDLSPTVRHTVRMYLNTNCGEFKVNVRPHNHLNAVLRDTNEEPSKIWKRAVGAFRQTKVVDIYIPKDVVITNLVVEYLKEPLKVYFGGYDTLEFLNGDATANSVGDSSVECELPEIYHSLLVDMVVQELANILKDIDRYNLMREKVAKVTI